MEKTVLCRTILRRLDEQAAAGLDRETLEHLRSCPECRRELLTLSLARAEALGTGSCWRAENPIVIAVFEKDGEDE